MTTTTISPLAERILSARNTDGGWGYRAGQDSAAEPTALSSLALMSHRTIESELTPGLQWLASQQRSDGSLAPLSKLDSPGWPTALAMLAWSSTGKNADRFAKPLRRAADWLLAQAGIALPVNPEVYGHDPSIVGWSWVAGTHSWTEPTAYAVMALRAAGHGDHPRVREGVRLLWDRAIPGGGWNYGNTRVYQNTLRPFPETSGVVLTALANEPARKSRDEAVEFLLRELPRIRAPLALCWGLIGLTACGQRPSAANNWLAQCEKMAQARESNVVHDALMLLAQEDASTNLVSF